MVFNKQVAPPISTSICQDVNKYIIIPKDMYIISAVVFNLYSFGLAKLISRGLLLVPPDYMEHLYQMQSSILATFI